MVQTKPRADRGSSAGRRACTTPMAVQGQAVAQSPRVNRLALPPAAVVLTVTVFSVAKRGR